MSKQEVIADAASARVDWVDIAKGICIIFVVMMHSTLGVGKATGETGWMHVVVAFAQPFRMPDFFLISGLFLGLVIERPWRRYADRKIVHFLYFYVLWLTIQFVFKAPGIASEGGIMAVVREYLLAFIEPFGTLWFIYILPVFFVVTRLLRPVPVWAVFIMAAALEILPIHTGWLMIDEFCSRYVYFFIGYAFAPAIFSLAKRVGARPLAGGIGLLIWGVVNAALVFTPATGWLARQIPEQIFTAGGLGGWADVPGLSLLAGLAGALVIVTASALLARLPFVGVLRWLGAHSIVVYLAFFLPMAVMRTVLLKSGIIDDIGTISLLTTIAGVIGPAVLYGLIQWSGYGRFLFERPAWASIEPRTRSRQAESAVAA
ncbi:MAG: acyltransferase family protein [Phyllobacterium sp.]